ncbi:hypothetical protein T440DRAFT_479792 [Plenodomus tracheiphilus IPT5]|uniref:Rhodopsin domain-containing protein n=1 Tax=Plenodomus tracheiphilus IPT5 TaxID=1408161 RepID=A0A6A7B289_9PLEO|nr:hypothetical protein T440DRAFT_479792 [Plenodomus tracheiphilus IPT5]
MAYEAIRPTHGGTTLIIISALMIPLTTMFIALRIWARFMLRKKLELNDYCIILGATLAVANAALTIAAVYYGGIGHQPAEVKLVTPTLMKFTTALSVICNFAHTIIKFSIVHLYLSIFSSSRRFSIASYLVIFTIFGYCVANVVLEAVTYGQGQEKRLSDSVWLGFHPIRTRFARWRSSITSCDGDAESAGAQHQATQTIQVARPKLDQTRIFFRMSDDNVDVGFGETGHSAVITTISGPQARGS